MEQTYYRAIRRHFMAMLGHLSVREILSNHALIEQTKVVSALLQALTK